MKPILSMFETKQYVVTYSHQQQQFFIETLNDLLIKNRVCYTENLPNQFYILAICDDLETAYQVKTDFQLGKEVTGNGQTNMPSINGHKKR